MRKYLLLLCLGGPLPATLFAQSPYTIEGTLKDTLNFQFTQHAVVSLVKASDSILQNFTYADENGHFSLTASDTGAYLMLFEHPRFATFVDKIKITKPETNLGIIPMLSKKHLLAEIKIIGKNAITIKGDTIEYAADSFKTSKYANVDDLLRKLPGIEVNADGSIKAYGKDVQKMLVDGEEFFSDDPAMVAKMLRASAVKTVQVYDKKSDKAEFTGIDDGKRIKTINLKLKDNAKHGYFGKVSAGGGLPDYWQNSAMINAFKGKRKMSAYFIMSNTNKGALDFNDSRNFGSGGRGFSVGGVTIRSGSSSDGYGMQGNYNGEGLPKTWTGGLHYNNSWWGDTLKFNGSYNFRKNEISTIDNTTTHYILPDTQYFNNNNNNQFRSNLNQTLSLNSTYQMDSLSSLRLRVNGTAGKKHSRLEQHSDAQAVDGTLVNENNQKAQSDGDNQNLNAYLRYRKKFHKKGRTLTANLNGSFSRSTDNILQQSEYHLYAIDSSKNIDQKKQNSNNNNSVSLGATYTEPLFKDAYLNLHYNFDINHQLSDRKTFNRSLSGGFEDVLDTLYSSRYNYDIMGNRGGLTFQYNPTKKINISLGGDIANTDYTQKDLMRQSTRKYSYLNFFPTLSFNYRKSRMSSFSFRYNGQSQQPSLTQLQPIRNNEDPLNVAIGNPNLKQAFSHNINMFYYNFQVLTGQSIFINSNLSLVQNAITQKQTIDFAGRRTYQYVNADGTNFNGNLNGSYGRRIVGKFRGRAGLSVGYRNIHNFINNLANINNSWSITPSLQFRYDLDTTLNLSYSFRPSYNSSVSEIRTDIKTEYWNYKQTFRAKLQLPFRFKIGTDINWEMRQQLNRNDVHNNVFLWNAWISRSFLKDRSLELKIYANDMLNQNIGYSRVTTANQISETHYNTIPRYFLLQLTWHFTHYGGQKQKQKVDLDKF